MEQDKLLNKIAKALGIDKTIDDYNFYYGEYGLSAEQAKNKQREWLVDDICDRIEELITKIDKIEKGGDV